MPRRRRSPGPTTQGGYKPGANAGGNVPQAPAAPTGMQYGANQATIAAQQAMPLPQVQTVPAAGPVPASPAGSGAPPPNALMQAMQQAAAMAPPSGGLLAPSARPSEPVTAGLPIGAGPGPEARPGMGAASVIGPSDDVLTSLYQAWQANPTDGLRRLIAVAEAQRGFGR